MSKFLKFIVHLIVILAIVCVLGLTIPPFFGVTTEIVDDPAQATNLPMGSVTYAIPERTDEINQGDPILVEEDGSVYRYEIQSVNLETHTGTVIDPSVTNGEPITVAVQDYVPKVVITIGYVGYLQVATKSTEGLIILGLCVLFLIILYVIAELWKKDGEGEYLGDPEQGNGYVKTEKELRKEEKERKKRLKQEEKEIVNQGKQSAKPKKKVHTGGFVDEIDENDDEEESYEEEPLTMQPEESEAHALLKKEVAAATAEDVAAAPKKEQKKISNSDDMTLDDMEEEVKPVKKRAIKSYSASELSDQAKQNGDRPDVVKDDVTEITLFDYSDILDDVLEDDD